MRRRSAAMPVDPSEYDSPWKEALERYFEAFMAFFFPEAHAQIDWSRGYEFLDTELQQVARDAELGRRLADKLVRVWRSGGEEAWVLIHVEVQGQPDTGFEERMYVYNYRLFDRYGHRVASMAVLGDSRADWRPDRFGYELFGCQVQLQFPVVKLLEYNGKWEALERSDNPFAVLVMAHLKTQATARQPESRLEWKLRLVKGLYERGFSREDVLELFRVIDWMMALPEELAASFEQSLQAFEGERNMPYITSVERHGIEKGLQQGLEQGVEQGRLEALREAVIDLVEARFPPMLEAVCAQIAAIEDSTRLKELHHRAAVANSTEELQASLDRLAGAQAPGR